MLLRCNGSIKPNKNSNKSTRVYSQEQGSQSLLPRIWPFFFFNQIKFFFYPSEFGVFCVWLREKKFSTPPSALILYHMTAHTYIHHITHYLTLLCCCSLRVHRTKHHWLHKGAWRYWWNYSKWVYFQQSNNAHSRVRKIRLRNKPDPPPHPFCGPRAVHLMATSFTAWIF